MKYLRSMTLVSLLAIAPSIHAQWPDRPVRIVVPFSSGTGLDVMARGFAERLQEQTGGSFIVENKDGAGGVIGAMAVANAKPDGYTLLFTAHAPFAAAPYMQAGRSYDPTADFTPLAKVAVTPMVLVASPSAPFTSFEQMVAYAKAHPGKLDFASSGVGTPSHLHMEVVKQRAGLDIVAVPYKNTGQAMSDLIGGQVALYMPSYPAALPQLRAKQIRPLAIGASKRVAEFPGMPTLGEALSQPGLEATVWYGFLAPAGMPVAAARRIHEQIAQAVGSEPVTAMIGRVGAAPLVEDPEAFAAQLVKDAQASRKLLRDLGFGTKASAH